MFSKLDSLVCRAQVLAEIPIRLASFRNFISGLLSCPDKDGERVIVSHHCSFFVETPFLN